MEVSLISREPQLSDLLRKALSYAAYRARTTFVADMIITFIDEGQSGRGAVAPAGPAVGNANPTEET